MTDSSTAKCGRPPSAPRTGLARARALGRACGPHARCTLVDVELGGRRRGLGRAEQLGEAPRRLLDRVGRRAHLALDGVAQVVRVGQGHLLDHERLRRRRAVRNKPRRVSDAAGRSCGHRQPTSTALLTPSMACATACFSRSSSPALASSAALPTAGRPPPSASASAVAATCQRPRRASRASADATARGGRAAYRPWTGSPRAAPAPRARRSWPRSAPGPRPARRPPAASRPAPQAP